MTRRTRMAVRGAAIVSLLVVALVRPAAGQSLRSVVEPRARVFPTVGPGVTAMKRDSSGRYYILAKPATVVSIYDADGNLVGQIPNANSHGAGIRYAVDIDLSPDGRLLVVDRGANAIEVFNLDGSFITRIPVIAPTSVVALPDGQIAVTTLTSKRLIQILNESGELVRSFGDPTDLEEDTEKKSLTDWGKIVGSVAGNIYFAFTSLPDPLLRRYDRYGYVGYQASVPRSFFEAAETTPTDRVEVRLNLAHLSLSDQSSGWISVGSSGDVKFGGGIGAGLSRAFGSGGSLARAGMQLSMRQPGLEGTPGGINGGTVGGTFSGQLTNQGTQFQFGAGNISSLKGGMRGGGGGEANVDQETPSGATLQFFGSEADNTGQVLSFTGGDSGSQGATTDPGQDSDLPAAFYDGIVFNSVGFQPPGPAGGMLGGLPGGRMRFGHPDLGGAGERGLDAGAHFGEGHFGPRGRFGPGQSDLTATVRINLGDLGRNSADKAVITATGVDPATGDLWAGIGSTLMHFSQDGNPVEVYYLTMKGGVALKPSAVLVEPDRFLIAVDPWGIFEFARPK